jgi:hypothetical protein
MIARANDDDRGPRPERHDPDPSIHASLGLAPGAHCRISEAEWSHFLQEDEPLHQWGGAYLVDEGEGRAVRIYLRDDSGKARHVCMRLDAERSARARVGVQEIEVASRDAADVITDLQSRSKHSLQDMEAQDRASRRFVETADGLYRELLAP